MNRRRFVAFHFFRRRRIVSDVGDQGGKTHAPAGKRFDPGTAQDRKDIASMWDGRIDVGELENERVVRPIESTTQSAEQAACILRRQFRHQATPGLLSCGTNRFARMGTNVFTQSAQRPRPRPQGRNLGAHNQGMPPICGDEQKPAPSLYRFRQGRVAQTDQRADLVLLEIRRLHNCVWATLRAQIRPRATERNLT